MRIPFEEDCYFSLNIDVVMADIPLIIALNDLKSKGLLLDFLEDQIEHIPSQASSQVRHKHVHSHIE